MSDDQACNQSTDRADTGKRGGCLWLTLLGLAFIVLVFGIIIYSITREQTADIQANELGAIQTCWDKANDPSATLTSRSFATDSCKEMEKQFRIKYGREPK
ncbi:hypothetical protein [Phytopseudomonas seleniipraecipitans]|uniref:Uncharacterized protein n=1 Tax=Phytopseudomonas seleniipraecipitans TaxID=640205 RepID=A0A1G7GD57_9GAMM|nr:hypothetical protein [Pseudomonas seleniipraecipitans]SDE86077.1 hypothetical protein SAMN05216381_0138 [Pseudomonas seleniipraecipitans]